MSVSIDYCRDMVANHSRYKDSPTWRDKVYRMPAGQILAIYHGMLHRGEFNKKETVEPVVLYTQPTLFDFGLEIDSEE